MQSNNVLCSKRRVSRFSAIQICYSFCVYPDRINSSFSDSFCSLGRCFNLRDLDMDLVTFLVGSVKLNCHDIDIVISTALDGSWSIDRLDLVVISILRVAVAELMGFDTPPQVIISEYVDIASSSMSVVEADFINAVLDRLYRSGIGVNSPIKESEDI